MPSQQLVEEVVAAIVEQKMENVQFTSSARTVDIPYSTVRKILHQMLQFHPYKISSIQELLPGNAATRLDFSLIFLAQMQGDATWLWHIL